MFHLFQLFIILLCSHLSFCNVTVTNDDHFEMNGFRTIDYIRKYGYPTEVHKNIQTEDGYLLDLIRIPHGVEGPNFWKKSPVLLMHGLLGNGENFIMTGPRHALAFLLADLGYDVWVGNCRGTHHSRKHIKWNADTDIEYWDFSWHEMGMYDLSAIIDYIQDITNRMRLSYIGHSQGTTIFFVLMSMRPEYNKYVKIFVGLAPSAFLGLKQITMPQAARSLLVGQIEALREELNIGEVGNQLDELFCDPPFSNALICTALKSMVVAGMNVDPLQLNLTMIPQIMQTVPDSASAKQALHYLHNILSAEFRQYDYGPEINMQKYKSAQPPSYPLKRISVPVALFSGLADVVVTPFNVVTLKRSLSNVALYYVVPYLTFTHVDFIIANDVVELCYKKIFELLEQYN